MPKVLSHIWEGMGTLIVKMPRLSLSLLRPTVRNGRHDMESLRADIRKVAADMRRIARKAGENG